MADTAKILDFTGKQAGSAAGASESEPSSPSGALGEVDFSIAPRIFTQRPDGGVSVTLRPHDLAYFQRIDPRFEWPAGVEVAGEGHPCLPVSGIRLEQPGFLAPPREA